MVRLSPFFCHVDRLVRGNRNTERGERLGSRSVTKRIEKSGFDLQVGHAPDGDAQAGGRTNSCPDAWNYRAWKSLQSNEPPTPSALWRRFCPDPGFAHIIELVQSGLVGSVDRLIRL